MNRLARYSVALAFAAVTLTTGVDGMPVVRAAPAPIDPGYSIDISTSQRGCHLTFASPQPRTGDTLAAGATNEQRSVASLARTAGRLDGIPPASATTQPTWSQACAAPLGSVD